MKGPSSSYYSRDQTSYSDSTRTPYIQEDESMMTYYSDESMERRQNKKLTYDTFVPMDSDSSRASTSKSGRRGWRKPGLSIDTRNNKVEDDEEADEAARKTLSPGMVDTENIRNIRRQRLARMARNRQDDDEEEENYNRRNHRRNNRHYRTKSLSPSKPSRYMPSPIVEEQPERSFSVSPRKHRYGSDHMAHEESQSPRHHSRSSPRKRPSYTPQSRSSPQKSGGRGAAFEPYKSPNHGKRNYNFDFADEEDDESYNANHSRGGSSNETRGSNESLGEEREDTYQSRRYESDARDDHRHHSSRFEYQDKGENSSTLSAKPSNDSDEVVYATSPSSHYERKNQERQNELSEQGSDDRVERREGYERRHDTSNHRDDQRDEAREDYDTSRYNTSNNWEHQEEEAVSPSKGRRHQPSTRDESQLVTYQAKHDCDISEITPAEGRHHHPSQNADRWRYNPDPSPREAIQAHRAQAYISPHGYQNPQYAAMANHNARHALLRRYGNNHMPPMRSPMVQPYGPMPPPSPRQPPATMQPSMHQQSLTPRQQAPPPSMHTPMPQQYQVRMHTTRKVAMPVVEDKSGSHSGRRMSPMLEDRSYFTVESHSVLNSSVGNGGAGCQAIQCQSVMTKIWTCGTIGDVDDMDPRAKILQGIAGESMAAFAMGANSKPQNALTKGTKQDENEQEPSGIIGTFEKISAEAQFLGSEAVNIFSDALHGNLNATSPEPAVQQQSPTKPAISVKSYGDDSSCSSDSSNTETQFDIGAPQPSPKKANRDEKKKKQVAEAKTPASEPRSPSNGIYASVIKNKFKQNQMAQRKKDREAAEASQKADTSNKQEFATGTDQLRDVYKQLFDTMNSPMNPLHVEKTGMDGETVFHSFDKGPESGTKRKTESKAATKNQPKEKPKPLEVKDSAAASGILSALENTLAQMMIPDTLSQANVEESVAGSIGGDTKSTDEQDAPVVETSITKELEALIVDPVKAAEAEPLSNLVMEDLLKRTDEQKTVEKQVMDDLQKKTEEQKALMTLDQMQTAKKTYEFAEIESVASMTDAEIEEELMRMIDDDTFEPSSAGPILINYDGPTDKAILAELMGDIQVDDDDGQDFVKSMFDDATVLDDDQTDAGSVLKPRAHFSNGVSSLKIISEETSDDLESLKRAAKALEEAIQKASVAEMQRTSGERAYAGENELPSSMSSGTDLTFTTAVMEETREKPSSWLGKMWRK